MRYVSFRKVARDIAREKARTIIVVAAIFLGVFAVAMMTSSYVLLSKNLSANYAKTNPASAIVVTDRVDSQGPPRGPLPDSHRRRNLQASTASIEGKAPRAPLLEGATQAPLIGAGLLDKLKDLPGIEDVEVRDTVLARVRTGPDTYIPLLLFWVSDFPGMRINKFTLEKGRFPEGADEIAIERTASKLTDVGVGGRYGVRIPGAGSYGAKVSGIVHDPGLAPSWMEGTLYGYVKQGFAAPEGSGENRSTILFTVKESKYDVDHIGTVLTGVVEALKQQGAAVYRTEIPRPGRHIHQSQMDSLMFLLLMFGLLTLFLSSFLIINMISAIMAREIRQIGVMKAIGAGTAKIAGIYLSLVAAMAICATVIATPVGIRAGTAYAGFVSSMLNFTLFDRSAGLLAVAGIVLTGIILPCLISLYPIYRRSSVTVHEALDDYGVDQKAGKGSGRFSRYLRSIDLPRTLLLSLRNTFRRRTRLVLTLMVLILGGAVFITTFNLRTSTTRTIEDRFDNQRFELGVVLNVPQPVEELRKVTSAVDGVEHSEYWGAAKITRVTDQGRESGIIDLRAIPMPSNLFSAEVIAGSWLEPADGQVAINHALAAEHPDLTVGKKARFKIGGKVREFTVKGIIREVFTPPTVYMDYNRYASLSGTQGRARLMLVDVSQRFVPGIDAVVKAVERRFDAEGIDVKMVYEKLAYKARMVDHLVVITSMLIMMTLLIILVGGLGIVTTMGINIIERKREIGILRAIGTNDRLLYRILMYEGLVTGIISWVCSVILALPLSYYLGNFFFAIFFETTINFTVSPVGIVAWFFINLVFSSVAVLIPARNAARTSVASALAYE